MKTQFLGIFVHIVGNYIFVYALNIGIIGTGIANFITNLFLLSYNIYKTN